MVQSCGVVNGAGPVTTEASVAQALAEVSVLVKWLSVSISGRLG